MITINELVEKLGNEGYKITPRTVKHYIDQGLLSRPWKHGGYKEGVRLVFEDEDLVLSELKEVFRLKGLGYKMSQINKAFSDRRRAKALEEKKIYLKRYIKSKGKYYFKLEESRIKARTWNNRREYPRYIKASNLAELINDDIYKEYELSECGNLETIKKDANKVEKLGLWIPQYFYKNKPIYDNSDWFNPLRWIKLRREYDFDWSLLKQLFVKCVENEAKYFFWPEPDAVGFRIDFSRQSLLNGSGSRIFETVLDFTDSFSNRPYENVNDFINDFLSGKCAYVPTFFEDDPIILKKFV